MSAMYFLKLILALLLILTFAEKSQNGRLIYAQKHSKKGERNVKTFFWERKDL